MISPKTVLKQWLKLPSKVRTPKLAREYAAKCGMKSIGEVKTAVELINLKSKKKIKDFKYEPEQISYQFKPQKYTPDFKVTLQNGETIYLEYKGELTGPVRKKMRAVKDCNPEKKIFIIFEKENNKLSRKSKSTYKEWAESNNISSSECEIKEEWLNGSK